MPRKPKESSHLRVRIEPALLARLEKSRAKNGQTLTGEIVARLEASFQREDHEEMIRRATDVAVKTTAGVAVVMALSELHLLPPQQPPGKPRLSNEEPARLFADKEEKSNKEEKSK